MKNILVISGHPELTHSVANATILDEVETALPDVEIRRLDRLYPDGKFNIAAEQESLLRADVIVWQFLFPVWAAGLMKNGWTRSLFTASRMAQRRNWAVKADPLLYNGSARGALYRRQFLWPYH